MLGFELVFAIPGIVNSFVMLGFLLVFGILGIVNSFVMLGFRYCEFNAGISIGTCYTRYCEFIMYDGIY